MSRESIVFIIGILIVLVPTLGVPILWKQWGLYVAGAVLVWCGYSLRRSAYLREISNESGELATDSFSESAANPVSVSEGNQETV